jgi:hypothetical protein
MADGGIQRTTLDEGARHEGFLRHRHYLWLKVSLALCLVAILAYALVDQRPRPNGGSALGYALGTTGALLILWLSLIGIRKRAMTRGRWSLKGWTSAHIYLGLSLIVVATLHTGFQLGWNVHSLAYVLMILVILSGLYGVAAYHALPVKLSNSRTEMTRPQMIDTIRKLDRQLQTAAQPLDTADTEIIRRSIAQDPFRAGLIARLSGSAESCRTAQGLALLRGRAPAAVDDQAEAVETVIGLLERKNAALSRIRAHLRVKALLEIWLYVHVPLTFGLLAALAAHIVSVFFYW